MTLDGKPLVVDGTVVATASSRRPSSPSSPPPGEPADPQTVAGITDTVSELVACENGGDALRNYALFTAATLRRLLANVVPAGDEEAFLESLAMSAPQSGEPKDTERAPIVEDVRVLSDGRVGALLTTDPVSSGEFLVFAKVGDRWLVDEVGAVGQGEASGTPFP